MRLEALSLCPTAFLGNFHNESIHPEAEWRQTFQFASWHACFLGEDHFPDRERIAGIAKSSLLAEFPGERYVESFWVRPSYRRLHIGRRILDSIIVEARKEQSKAIRLSVLTSNDQAMKAFRNLGFSTVVEARSSESEICLELPLLDYSQSSDLHDQAVPIFQRHLT